MLQPWRSGGDHPNLEKEKEKKPQKNWKPVKKIFIDTTSQHGHLPTHILIAVPTLLRPDRSIDSSYLRDALKNVAMYAREGVTVVVESSVTVGMTRQLLGPLAASKKLFAGMSPEVSRAA